MSLTNSTTSSESEISIPEGSKRLIFDDINDITCFTYCQPSQPNFKSPKLWAESKKSLLTYRLYDYVVNLLQQNGYRLIGGRSWYVMLQWVENLNNGCRDFARI